MTKKKIKNIKVKSKLKFSDQVRWVTCGNCGHTLYGTTVVSGMIEWPKPVKPPKKEKVK